MPIGFGTLTGLRGFGRGFITGGAGSFTGTLISSASSSTSTLNTQSGSASYSNSPDYGGHSVKCVGYGTSGTTEYFFCVFVNSRQSLYNAIITVTPSSVSVGSVTNMYNFGGSYYIHDIDLAFNSAINRIALYVTTQYSYGGFRQRYEYHDLWGWEWTTDGTSSLSATQSGPTQYQYYSRGYGYGWHECDGCSPYTTDSSLMDVGIENDNTNSVFRGRTWNAYADMGNNRNYTSTGASTDDISTAYRRGVATGPSTTYPYVLSRQSGNTATFSGQNSSGSTVHTLSQSCNSTPKALSDVVRCGADRYLWLVENTLLLVNYSGSGSPTSVTTLALVNDGTTSWVDIQCRPTTYGGTTGLWVATLASTGDSATNSTVHYGTYTGSSITLIGKSTITSTGATAWASAAWAYNGGAASDSNAKLLICGRDSSTGYAEFHALI